MPHSVCVPQAADPPIKPIAQVDKVVATNSAPSELEAKIATKVAEAATSEPQLTVGQKRKNILKRLNENIEE